MTYNNLHVPRERDEAILLMQRTGRAGTGIEISPKYFEIACR